ncbi:hypothetical protein NDU88_002195 [Pleurodeles waltl]|uniref:Uncharacterized protein n=1 Tax=Pleurodeles waltl TaxID=8319 RepID=A0AAV7P8R8_PLEWA|nr:hypothetical protein NDU88_002195 [Pleurodeles waltl]
MSPSQSARAQIYSRARLQPLLRREQRRDNASAPHPACAEAESHRSGHVYDLQPTSSRDPLGGGRSWGNV